MPEKFKFDFSKPEETAKFNKLTEEEKVKINEEAHDEANLMQEKIKNNKAKNYNEAEQLIEEEFSPEVIRAIMDKVQDINKIGTAFTSTDNDRLDSILKYGILGTNPDLNLPEMGGPIGEKRKETWIKNVKKTKKGVVFFNIIGPSGNDRGESSTMKTIKAKEGVSIIFDLSKYTPDFPLKTNRYGSGEGGEQKPNTYRYGLESYYNVKPDKETAKKNYNEIQRERKNYPDKRFDVGFNDKNWYLYLPPIVNDYGFSLSFRIAPRLFKGLVVNPERKLNRQEIKDGIEKIEKIYEEYLRRVREDKKFRERTDLEHNAKIYEEVKNGLIHYGKTEELDTEKRKEFAEKVALKMIGINKGKPKNLVPLYDLDGNLLWPKQMSYEEVKKFVAERDKNKINDQKE